MATPSLPAKLALPQPDDGRWLKGLRGSVEPSIFTAGRKLAEAQRVSDLSLETEAIAASVQDGGEKEVRLSPLAAGGFGATCDCGAQKPCAHVVAAALVYLTRLRSRTVAAPTTSPTVAGWLDIPTTGTREFTYRLAPSGVPGTARTWSFEVRSGESRGPVQVKRILEEGGLNPDDERVFMLLAEKELRFNAKFVLSDEELAELLWPLRQRRVIYRGTPLLFSEQPVRPLIRVVQEPSRSFAELGFSLPTGKVMSLRETVALAGSRTWVIAGQTAHPVEPDFSARQWRKWSREPLLPLGEGGADAALEYFTTTLPVAGFGLQAEGIAVEEGVAPTFALLLDGSPMMASGRLFAHYREAEQIPLDSSRPPKGYASSKSGGTRRLYLRNMETERTAILGLTTAGFRFDRTGLRWELSGDDALAFWAAGRSALPPEWDVRYAAAPPPVRIRSTVHPRFRVAMPGVSWFELETEFDSEGETATIESIRNTIASKSKYVPLEDGSFALLDREKIEHALAMLDELGGVAAKGAPTRLPLHQVGVLDALSDFGDLEVDDQARQALTRLKSADKIPMIQAPKELQATLRHYQEVGLSWLWFLYELGLSGVLADDMGLGKTIQALALLLKVRNEHGSEPCLVVAPTSVLPNWEREIERFAPVLKVLTWHGADRRENIERLSHADVVLTSYALVRRDVNELKKVKFRSVILDEAQNIKNADSATAQACKSIVARHRIALTGTPLENRLGELWSLFDFLMPGFLGSSDHFQERFETPIVVERDERVRTNLKKRIHPFVLRRIKTAVTTDLPPKTEVVTWVEMDAAQAALYREVLAESKRKIYESIDRKGFSRSRISILAALTRLRQVCCDPRLLKTAPTGPMPPSAKYSRFFELVEEIIGESHRALVFSQFTEMLALLTAGADERGIPYSYLDGRTRDRMARVDAFNEPNGPPIFFISLKAGGTGLNLTAADYVIHFDPWWNPSVEDQATDRIHRIGQTRAVFSYKLITKGTVEERILDLQRSKRDLVNGVLSTEAWVGKSLSEGDLEDLFRLD